MAMDLNELLHQHQASVMRAAAAGHNADRDDHFAKVAEYAKRIRALREVEPQANPRTPGDGPPTIIYGSYAGDSADLAGNTPTASWEDEGGAVRNPSQEQGADISEKLVRYYHVGPYVYQDLNLAVAEHMRQLAAADDGAT